jgi:hypothetical protein
MRTLNGSTWVPFAAKVYNGTVWQPATVYVGEATGWRAWVFDTAVYDVGYHQVTYWILAEVNYTPPSTRRIVALRASGWFDQHVQISENQGVMDLTIEGWNGSSWVTLAYSRIGAPSTGIHELTVNCSFSPYNTTYSQFRFRNGGNSFTRGVTGFVTQSFNRVTVPYQ